MSNKEYKIEVIDAPTNEVIEKDTGSCLSHSLLQRSLLEHQEFM